MSRTSNRCAGFSCGNPACPTGTRCPLHGGTLLSFPKNSADCCACYRSGRCSWHGGTSVRDYLFRPSGALRMDGMSLDAVEGGSVMLRPHHTDRIIILNRRDVLFLYHLKDETLIRNMISAYVAEWVR